LGGAILGLTLLFLILVLAGGRRTPPAGPAPAGAVLPAGSEQMQEPAAAAPLPVRGRESPSPKTGMIRKDAVAPATTPQKEIPEKPAIPEEKSHQNAKGFAESVLWNNTVMVHIPPGEFSMGSTPGDGDDDEYPLHKVYIGGFWIAKYEATFAQYDRFAGESGRPLPADEGWGRGERPVINVSWDDAQAYCRWLSDKTGRTFRLPTEAEWEKAARFKFPWGGAAPDGKRANYQKADDRYPHTAPVGSFPKGISFYGTLDMAGNVWEWVADWYDPRYYRISSAANPAGPAVGPGRAVRGGSWGNSASFIRSANRSSEKPERRLNILGFRVAMDEKRP
jgi:formylglycine-generating enzyme required for sulfatase activity